MSKIYIYHIGKIKNSFVKGLIEEISKRLQRVKIIELKECKGSTIEEIKFKEFETLTSVFNKHKKVYICSEFGTQYSTQEFSTFISQNEEITFILSGAYGPHNKTVECAKGLISLSKMIFTHEMALYILIEQCYRAQCVRNNIKYTK